MRKLYSFFTIVLIGLYIGYLYLDVRRIYIYTTDRYFYTILISGAVLVLFGLVGIFIFLKQKNELNTFFQNLKGVFTDGKLALILFLSLLGFLTSQVFLLLAAFVSLVHFKNSFFEVILDKNIFRPALLVTVVILGVILPSGQISSATADQRIGNFNTVALDSNVKSINSFNTNTKNYNIGDWIVSLSYNPDLNYYKGKEVGVTGFVFVPDNLPENIFILGRFVIRCCAADATPVGLRVKYDWRDEFKQDQWLRVTGKFDIANINGIEELIIVPDKIEETEIPDRPYIN